MFTKSTVYLFLLAVMLLMASCLQAAPPFIWVEGELPTAKSDIVDNSGFNSINPYAMSGNGWLSSFTEVPGKVSGTAEYIVDINTAGTYKFWLRAVTDIEYKVDDGNYILLDGKKGVNKYNTAANGNWGWPPQISWYNLGTLDLTAGKHKFSFIIGATKKEGKQAMGAIDCFVLTTEEFTPNGKYKPTDDAPKPFYDIKPGTGWDFTPAKDTLDAKSMLDLRYLNEKEAGEHGLIGKSKDGNSFVTTIDGKPIRFWGGSEYNQRNMTLEQLKVHAQFLAKRGVNIVRTHMALEPKGENSKVTDVDEKELNETFKLVTAMKSAGIYTIISPYWGTACKVKKSWGTLGTPGNNGSGLLFVDPVMQSGYKAWIKELYTRPNPYSGIKLADDPAVAIIQIQNEDSLLFWTFGNLSKDAMTRFRTLFADDMKKKYGSLEKTREAWKNYSPAGGELWIQHEWDKGLPGLSHPWDFTRDGMVKKGPWPGFTEYTSDLLEFTTRLMYDFNTDIANYLRKDLGCKQLINAGNWKGVDPSTEQDVEYWSYTANDVIGRNFYASGIHVGPNDGWQILNGHIYSNLSCIKEPTTLPISLKQPVGYPFIVPETLWVTPSLYQSECAPLVAAQTALTGLDIAFWFADGVPEWDASPQGMWTYATPMTLGQFPASALMFRQAYVAEGKPAVVEQRSMKNLWERKTQIISEESSYDPNRDKENIPLTSSVKTVVDPLAFLVGSVQVKFDGDPAKSSVVDMKKYIDRDKKIVRSITGELTTNYGKGIYLINAPKAQGALGFLGGNGVQKLKDVTIECKNRYASIVVASLDGKNIKDSAKVLLQAGTISRPTDWMSVEDSIYQNKQKVDCFKIISTGKTPYQVENTEAIVTVANKKLTTVTVLDVNGMPIGEPTTLTFKNGKVSVTMPKNALYVVLTSGK
jgi:hypothetical protein